MDSFLNHFHTKGHDNRALTTEYIYVFKIRAICYSDFSDVNALIMGSVKFNLRGYSVQFALES